MSLLLILIPYRSARKEAKYVTNALPVAEKARQKQRRRSTALNAGGGDAATASAACIP